MVSARLIVITPRRHRTAAATALALGALLAVAGCASDPAGSGTTELRYQTWRLADPGVIGDMHASWIEEFNTEHDDLLVSGEEVPFDKKGDILLNQILAGDPPDVVAVSTADVPQYAQYMLPLDGLYAQEGAEFEDSFIEGARELVSWDEQYYGVAVEMGPVDGLYYNKELLAQAGVDPERAVESWRSFTEALTKVEALGDDVSGLVMAGKDASRVDYMWAWFDTAGAPLGNEDDLAANLCSAEGQETFTYLTETFTKHGFGPSPVDIGFDEYVSTFAAGKTAFAQGGAWMYDIFIEANPELDGELGVTHLPPAEAGGDPGVILDAVALMIPKDSKNHEQAWELVKFLSSPEKQLQDAVDAGFLPTIASVADEPELAELDRLEFYAGLAVDHGFPRPRTEHLAEVRQAIWEQWQRALLSQASPEESLKQACTAVDSVLQ